MRDTVRSDFYFLTINYRPVNICRTFFLLTKYNHIGFFRFSVANLIIMEDAKLSEMADVKSVLSSDNQSLVNKAPKRKKKVLTEEEYTGVR